MLANLFKVAGGETLARAANWITAVVLAKLLPTESYAFFILLVALEALFQIVGALGHDKLILLEENENLQKKLARNSLIVSTCLLIIFASIIFIWTKLAPVRGSPSALNLGLFVALGVATVANRLFTTIIRSSYADTAYLTNRIIYSIARLFFPIVSAVTCPENFEFLALSIVTPNMLSLIYSSFRMNPRNDEDLAPPIRIADSIKSGMPFLWHNMSAYLISFGDRFVVAAIANVHLLAAYGFWQSVVSGVQFIYAALTAFFEPRIYKEVRNTGRHKTLISYAIYSTGGVAFSALLLVCFMAWGSWPGIPALYLKESWIALPLIVISVTQGMYFSAVYLLAAHDKSTSLAKTGNLLITLNLLMFSASIFIQSIGFLLFSKYIIAIIIPSLMLHISKLRAVIFLPTNIQRAIAAQLAVGVAVTGYSIAVRNVEIVALIAWIISALFIVVSIKQYEFDTRSA